MLSSLYLASDAARPPLRVGVVVPSEVLPRHLANVLDDIATSSVATLCLVVRLEQPGGPHGLEARPLRRILRSDPGHLLFDLYARGDARRAQREAPFEPVDCAARLRSAKVISLGGDGQAPSLPAREAVRRERLDVLLDLGTGAAADGLASCARHGIWSFRFGGDAPSCDGLARATSFLQGGEVAEAALVARLGTPARTLTLCRVLGRPEPTIWASRNFAAPAMESRHFAIWKLSELHRDGWSSVEALAEESGGAAPADARSTSNVVRALGARGLQLARARLGGIGHCRSWKIGLRTAGPQLCQPAGESSLAGFRWIAPPRGHYWADPVVVAWRGRRFLFVEDFQHERRFQLRALELCDGQGVIGCAEVLADGRLGPMETVLRTESHLSYPMVFQEGNEAYLVPESGAAGEVALYRATDFPRGWQKEAVLFDRCRAVDTTVLHLDGTWWFFTTLSDGGDSLKLMLFYADTLTGAWRPHPANPISSDVRNCRGAGPIVQDGPSLLRPSQSCAPEYGYSFTLNEIVELTRTRYRERPWRTVLPDPALRLIGTHQYSRCDGLEVVDGCAWAPLRSQRASRTR